MRQYYKSDKKRREDSKRRKSEEKRVKRLNKNSKGTDQTGPESTNTAGSESEIKVEDLKN